MGFRAAADARFLPALVAFGAAALFALNHPEPGERYSLTLVGFACLGFVLGVFGLIDPRIFWAIGPRRHRMPMAARVAGGVAVALSVVLFFAIEFGVYGV